MRLYCFLFLWSTFRYICGYDDCQNISKSTSDDDVDDYDDAFPVVIFSPLHLVIVVAVEVRVMRLSAQTAATSAVL